MPCFRTEGAQSVISPSISLSKAFETPYAESSVIKVREGTVFKGMLKDVIE